jgi:hypothetical protein
MNGEETMTLHRSRTLALAGGFALLIVNSTEPTNAQTAREHAASYKREAMEQALQTKERFDLYGLHFDSGAAKLQSNASAILNDIATALKNFPEWHLRIIGHTDSRGDVSHNEALSTERAKAVQTALLERGVDPQRLSISGAGEAHPVASNETAKGRALNRRVELARFTNSTEARKLLKSMSDFLATQKMLSFAFDSTLEVITPSDQKLGLAASGIATLNRPDKIRVTRQGGFADTELIFDGKTLTLFGKNANLFTQVSSPGTVDQLIDDLRNKYNRPLPAADLLVTNSYDELVRDVYDAKDLGSGVINGQECDSLAFRKDDVDWQIWVAQGDRPFPCRMIVTSRSMKSAPQYSIQFRDWKAGSDVAATNFTFENASNARKIDFTDLKGKLGDIPDHFVAGADK